MPDMGYRDNVMGPQPIAKRKPVPQSLLDSVTRILDLLANGKGSELIAMTVDTAKDETAKLAAAVKAGTYNDKSVIATARTNGPALAISKGIDRDRAVDESGNQLAVFGRRGARPFNLQEMQRFYLRDDKLYTVTDTPPGPAVNAIEPQRASTGQQGPGQ